MLPPPVIPSLNPTACAFPAYQESLAWQNQTISPISGFDAKDLRLRLKPKWRHFVHHASLVLGFLVWTWLTTGISDQTLRHELKTHQAVFALSYPPHIQRVISYTACSSSLRLPRMSHMFSRNARKAGRANPVVSFQPVHMDMAVSTTYRDYFLTLLLVSLTFL